MLLEGPVGVGKTFLALSVSETLRRPVFRIDGDNRYSEQKLTGWFDPPTVIQKGYVPEAFVPGPLVEAMKSGGVLFINELNRLPESVQNVLLPAIDERMILIPRLGEIRAAPAFQVIATQNPKEFVATSHLSEAILDRFELVVMEYQSEEEETEIVRQKLRELTVAKRVDPLLAPLAVRIVRLTRSHPRFRRGASIRGAIGVAELSSLLMEQQVDIRSAVLQAAWMAIPTRVEIEREGDSRQSVHEEARALIEEVVAEAFEQLLGAGDGKKKT